MNALARVVLGFLSLSWIAACGGLIAMAWNGDQKLDIDFADFDLEAFIVAGDMEKYLFTVIVGLLALLGILAFLLVFVRSGSGGATKGAVRLRQADGGTVEVTTEALEALVASEMLELPDVRSARAWVHKKGNAVETELSLVIGGGVSIANVTANAGTKLNEVFRDQVGVVDVRRPLVRIEYDGAPRSVAPQPARVATPPVSSSSVAPTTTAEAPLAPPVTETLPPPHERRLSFERPVPPPPEEEPPRSSTHSITLPPPPEPPAEHPRE